jgi:hypothetical protein
MTVVARQSVLFGEEQAEATSDDVYTPRWVFEQLGLTFDLDVAAPPGGIPYIPAERYFTKADDALSQPWRGRVWMNPPYSACTPWVHRWLEHGNGVALLPCAKSRWFWTLWKEADAIHVPEVFTFANGVSISYPVLLAAMGDDNAEALARLGRVR